ncbi:MAG: thioredoxin fold domain-containing protein [Burkholderiales bacterium]
MTRLVLIAAIPLLIVACSKASESVSAPQVLTVAHASIDWVKPEGASLEAVFAKAKVENKPVFLYWGAVWCPPCNQIKATVFNRPDFIERSKGFIPVYLDGDTPGAQKLATQFKVRGYPTTILFKPDGIELTRLPGEVDAVQYMQILKMGMTATQPIKETLNAALATPGGVAPALSTDGWNMLAYYAWDTDEAQLLAQRDVVPTLQQLAQNCPPQYAEALARLSLRATAMSGGEQVPAKAQPHMLAAVTQILADAPRARANGDILSNYANELVTALTAAGSAERSSLTNALNIALDRLSIEPTLSKADQLGAVQAKVTMALLGKPKSSKPELPSELVAQAQAAATKADQTATDRYERQAIIPSAAHLLTDVGLIDASDAMLIAELPKAVSGYYHMLVLASNAKLRGDKTASLDWAEKAYAGSLGPATRLQWGSGFVNKLIELSPQDSARIEKAASQVIGELDAAPDTFYERNRRSLEKMGIQLNQWNANGKNTGVMKKLTAQLDGICGKLPEADVARAACKGVFGKVPKKA